MNRIHLAISRMEEKIRSKNLPQDKLLEIAKSLDMQMDEYMSFQNLKSVASQTGKLTLEEAQTIYSYLGNTLEQFNRQPLAVKAVLTQIFKELLDSHIGQRVSFSHIK